MSARIATVVLWLLAAMAILLGLRWIVEPQAAAAMLGMPLLEGVGRSTQIGDIGAFFLGNAALIMLGILTRRDSWLHAAAIFFILTAAMRTLAWLLHDATLTVDLIAVEVALGATLLTAGRNRHG